MRAGIKPSLSESVNLVARVKRLIDSSPPPIAAPLSPIHVRKFNMTVENFPTFSAATTFHNNLRTGPARANIAFHFLESS